MLSQGDRPGISVVVPTRNRKQHLFTLLNSVSRQTLTPQEVIVVDSSDDQSYHKQITQGYPSLNVRFIRSEASVCIQRNIGIRAALNEWVLLIDDDIEIEPEYLSILIGYAADIPECGAFAGRLMQLEQDVWTDQYPPPSARGLIFKFIFQLPVWGDITEAEEFRKPFFLSSTIRKFYETRGNTFALSGWPLITKWERNFRTTIYSLGANLIKRQWLLDSPYAEVLDSNGIGDNYGVALGFPGTGGIFVTDDVKAFHHRAQENRLENAVAYNKRVLALHYFISRSKRFHRWNLIWFYWSVFGNALLFLIKGKGRLTLYSWKALALMVTGRNPYSLRERKLKQQRATN
jgi:glycosyltransferase involved in cell wall biosynthesis